MDTRGKNRMHLTGKRPRRRPSPANRSGGEQEVHIQYTPAKPFNRNRFLLRLATVAAVVVALVVGMSIFFKVDIGQVLVSGAEKYSAYDVVKASGIQDGEGLLGLNKAQIGARICEKLPYVESVRVGIKLPDTVNIEIVERTVVYAVEDTASVWWLLNADGRILDSADAAAAKTHTRITGVKLQSAVVGEQAVAAEPVSEDAAATEPTLPPISGKSRLDAAMQVVSGLENNGIMGVADTVDVADPENVVLLYESRFEVTLGDTSRLDFKIASMKAAITEMGQYESGYLDVSFTIYPNEVQHRPFDGGSGTKK